jgi:predicted site-specific integrase-resolvase
MTDDIMFTKEQLAERWQVSEYTIMRWYRKGALRGVALSDKTVRFPATVVHDFERSGVPKDQAAKRRPNPRTP